MTDIAVIDCTTGDVIVRPMTDDEQTRHASIIDTPAPPAPDDLTAQIAALTDTVAQIAQAQAGVDPEVMGQLVTLGSALVDSADQLQAALGGVAQTNTAKAPLAVINSAVQAAAAAQD